MSAGDGRRDDDRAPLRGRRARPVEVASVGLEGGGTLIARLAAGTTGARVQPHRRRRAPVARPQRGMDVSTTRRAACARLSRRTVPARLRRRRGRAAESFARIDPSTGERLGARRRGVRRPTSTRAVARGRAAFRGWRETSPGERQETLERIAERDRGRRRLAEPARDRERPPDPRGAHRRRARPRPTSSATTPVSCAALDGDTVPTGSRDSLVSTTREPLGVIARADPLELAADLDRAEGRAGARRRATRSCSSRPSSPRRASSSSRAASGDLLPAGVVNVVTGFGPEAGAALVASPGVAKISFTGGIPTARRDPRAPRPRTSPRRSSSSAARAPS